MRLLGKKHSLDVGKNAALSNSYARQQPVELFVVADSQLQVSGDDPRFLVVSGRVARQLEHFGSQIFHDSRQVDRSSGADPFSVVAFLQVSVDATDWELESCPRGTGFCLLASFATFSTPSHDNLQSQTTPIELNKER